MSSQTRQRFRLFRVQCRVILDSAVHYQVLCRVTINNAFCRFRCNVESHTTALSVVPGSMSSHTRQRRPLPSPMSSHTRQLFPLLQVQCRVIHDSSVHYQSYVESNSTVLSAVTGTMSSHTRQSCLLYQVQYLAQIDVLFYCVITTPSLSFCKLVAAFRL
jgi:hypothetical protein